MTEIAIALLTGWLIVWGLGVVISFVRRTFSDG